MNDFKDIIDNIWMGILINNIAGIASLTVLWKLVKCIVAQYKYRKFNGYWILMIHNGNIEYFRLLYLRELFSKKIKFRKIPIRDKKKMPNCLESISSSEEIYKSEGIIMESNLVLNLRHEVYGGYASLSSPSNENIFNSEYCYWLGKFFPTKWQGDIFNGKPFEISLTKVNNVEEIEEIIKYSKQNQMRICKENLSKDIILSVIVTVFNNEKTIEGCLKSIINNGNNENIEIIIIDDGSYDMTSKFIEKCKVSEKNVKLIKTLHRGINFSRNVGLSVARGKYFMFIDAADTLTDGIIDHLINLAKLDMDIVMGGYCEITELGRVQHVANREIAGKYNGIKFATNRKKLRELQLGSACGKLYKNSLIRRLQCKFEENYYGDTWFNIEIQKSMPLVYVDERAWYNYDSRCQHFFRKEMSIVEYFGVQFNVLLRYIDTMNSLPINKKMKEKCIKEYHNDVRKRVVGEIRGGGRRAI